MIKLKSGNIIEYDSNLDVFFQNLMNGIIKECYDNVEIVKNERASESSSEILLKEIMDQSIYISSQIFDIYKINKKIAEFLLTGFLFNSIVLSVPHLKEKFDENGEINDNDATIH